MADSCFLFLFSLIFCGGVCGFLWFVALGLWLLVCFVTGFVFIMCVCVCAFVCVCAGVAEGTIDMREFLLGMNNFSGDERVDKCRFAFMLYDEDKNGFLTMEELVQVLKATHMATKAQQVMKKAQTIMKQCDRDGDGHIDPEEFVSATCVCSNTLWGMLWDSALWSRGGEEVYLTFCCLFVLFYQEIIAEKFPNILFPNYGKMVVGSWWWLLRCCW